jgi:hypothetical protein
MRPLRSCFPRLSLAAAPALLAAAAAAAADAPLRAADAAAPLFAAAGKGAAQPTGDATPLLALAAVAMMATLVLAQRLVSRRR